MGHYTEEYGWVDEDEPVEDKPALWVTQQKPTPKLKLSGNGKRAFTKEENRQGQLLGSQSRKGTALAREIARKAAQARWGKK